MQNYHGIWDKTTKELQLEWFAILRAKGFGHSFETWMRQELQWPMCPRFVPSLAVISLLEQVVKQLFQEKMSNDQKIFQKSKVFSRYLDRKK